MCLLWLGLFQTVPLQFVSKHNAFQVVECQFVSDVVVEGQGQSVLTVTLAYDGDGCCKSVRVLLCGSVRWWTKSW